MIPAAEFAGVYPVTSKLVLLQQYPDCVIGSCGGAVLDLGCAAAAAITAFARHAAIVNIYSCQGRP